METTAKPIVATTSRSFLLHSVAFAGLLLAFDQVSSPDGGVGRGVEIELISSVLVSDQQEADVPHRSEIISETKPDSAPETLMHEEKKKFSENFLQTAFLAQKLRKRSLLVSQQKKM